MPLRGFNLPSAFRRRADRVPGGSGPLASWEPLRSIGIGLERWGEWVREQPALDIAYIVALVVVLSLAAFLLLTAS